MWKRKHLLVMQNLLEFNFNLSSFIYFLTSLHLPNTLSPTINPSSPLISQHPSISTPILILHTQNSLPPFLLHLFRFLNSVISQNSLVPLFSYYILSLNRHRPSQFGRIPLLFLSKNPFWTVWGSKMGKEI